MEVLDTNWANRDRRLWVVLGCLAIVLLVLPATYVIRPFSTGFVTWEPRAVSVDGQTLVESDAGGRFVLEGSWRMTDAIQGPRALVHVYVDRGWPPFFGPVAHLQVLDAGARTPRRVLELGRYAHWSLGVTATSFATPPTLGWFEDGDALVGWFDETRQLCGLDVADGEVTSLATFPGSWTGDGSYDSWDLDSPLVGRRGGMVEDSEHGRLLFLQLSSDPAGSYELVSVELAGGTIERPFPEKPLAADVVSWDLSLDRGELFVLVGAPDGSDERELRVHDLVGTQLRTLPLPAGKARAVHLSPDGRALLVESGGKGFALLDLDSNTLRAGPTAGWYASWSPDGSRIAYRGPSGLLLWNVATGQSQLIAHSEPRAGSSNSSGPSQWSWDGKALLTSWLGESPRTLVVLELDRHTFTVISGEGSDYLWAPSRRPLDW